MCLSQHFNLKTTSLRLSARSMHLNDGATGTVTLDLTVRTDAAVTQALRRIQFQKRGNQKLIQEIIKKLKI